MEVYKTSDDDDIRPIVIKTKKKKKRKYSRGLQGWQRTGRGLTKGSSRLARATLKGIKTYRKASDKSARKKRDGAMRDAGINLTKAFSKSLRIASGAPYDVAKAMNGRGMSKTVRRQIRAVARMNRLLRIR